MKRIKSLILLFLFFIPALTEAQLDPPNLTFSPVSGGNCCFDITLTNSNENYYSCFQINSAYNSSAQTNIVSIHSSTFSTEPSYIISPITSVKWRTASAFPTGSYSVGNICFTPQNQFYNFSLQIKWSTNWGATFIQTTTYDLSCGNSGCETAVPSFSMKDTVCSIDSIKIDGSSSQFETDYRISVQKLGGSGPEISEWFTGEAGIFDLKTWYEGKGAVFECGEYYRIKLGVKNACTDLRDTNKLLFVKCCDTCAGTIKAPPSIFYTIGNYPVIPKIYVSNFTGTGDYAWQLIPDNPAQCPGGSGTVTGGGPFTITLNQRINATCTYTLTIWRGDCVALTPVKLIPCPCD